MKTWVATFVVIIKIVTFLLKKFLKVLEKLKEFGTKYQFAIYTGIS